MQIHADTGRCEGHGVGADVVPQVLELDDGPWS